MINPLTQYCDDCDTVNACVCDDGEVNRRFVNQHTNIEDQGNWNPPYWAGAVMRNRPVRLDPTSKAFWSYSKGVWREDREVVERRLPSMLANRFRNRQIADVKGYMFSKLHKDDLVIYPDRPDTRYISLPSGLYNIGTGEIEDHTSDVLATYQLQADPDFGSEIPMFVNFVREVVHADDVDRVLDILAYLIMPGNKHQKAVMFVGSGRNGKGVLLDLIESIVGRQHTSHVSLKDLAGQFASSELYGKVLNIVGDIDGDHITSTGKFKQITGEDTVRMDVKHQTAFSAKVWAVPVFSANLIPTSADTSDGYLRRWEVVEFPHKIENPDPALKEKLRAEIPGIIGYL